MTELSFHLPEDFIETYKDRKVDWGFVDAGGNSLGEITFLRTYSRIKEDGSKERWHEVCQRVVEGMFSIQKDWCKTSRLPWNDRKAQASAQEAYDRLFDLKWTPPGRGLWVMGTPLVNEQKNSAALQNPLHEDTKVFTRTGWQRLGDLEGQDVELLSSSFLYGRDNGDATGGTSKWVKGFVSFIEEQPSIEISYTDVMGTKRSIIASENHRWFVASGSGKRDWKRVAGTELKVGDYLPTVKPRINYLPSHSGMQHGFFFGDGSRSNGEFEQFGSSTAVLARLFGDQVKYRSRRAWVGQCPLAWGYLPEGRYLEDQRYIYGFLAGYFAADGCVGKDGSMSISSARREELGKVVELFSNAGIETSEPRLSSTSSNFSEERELWTVRINRFDVTEDFFLKLEHRERWLATTYAKDRTKTRIRITDIKSAGTQKVLCATVPEHEQFVTEGYILTSNCAFVSTSEMTKYDPSKPFRFLMEASMLGIGVGFDTLGAKKEIQVTEPRYIADTVTIPDTREGWVDLAGTVIDGFLKGGAIPVWDYSEIRPEGAEIKTFGGTAAGPEPLMKLERKLTEIFKDNIGNLVDTRLIADIGNLIGICVVSGNVRRSAELLVGSVDDPQFLALKDYNGVGAERAEWGWMSNNSVAVNVGDDLSAIVEGIAQNGEPGVLWMDVSRQYGRLEDSRNNRDYRAAGYNPCAEQTLESMECCTLVETFLNRHDDLEDYQRTLKYAYMYAKTVTLLPTHWAETNAIMQRNRRIGTSMSGIANFADDNGLPELKKWMNESYPVVQAYDTTYSEWLGIRESIKNTTVKPSGTVSILAGASPGAHWGPGDEFYYRLIRFSSFDPMVEKFRAAGYKVETDVANPETTVVVYFPMQNVGKRTEKMVSIFEKINLAATAQRYWSDNSVSVTVSFDKDTERDDVETVLHMYEGQLKTVSFLPQGNETYAQMPYTSITREEYEEVGTALKKVNLNSVYKGKALEAVGEAYCTNDICIIPTTVES